MAHGLDMEIQFLPGVGPKRAELLRKELAVETVGDLIRLYPFRYIDKTTLVRICRLLEDNPATELVWKTGRGVQGLQAKRAAP